MLAPVGLARPLMGLKDRYFVVNLYRSKGGYWKSEAPVERPTHEAATATACLSYLGTVDLAGPDGAEREKWIVFVGSKTKLDRYLAQFKGFAK